MDMVSCSYSFRSLYPTSFSACLIVYGEYHRAFEGPTSSSIIQFDSAFSTDCRLSVDSPISSSRATLIYEPCFSRTALRLSENGRLLVLYTPTATRLDFSKCRTHLTTISLGIHYPSSTQWVVRFDDSGYLNLISPIFLS